MSEQLALAVYMKDPKVMTKFTDILGDSGKSYVQSVLIAVAGSTELMKCTNESIFRSALRAASLGLSCDPALKQAWMVPYNRNVGTKDNPKWVKEAQFQPHYKGLYTLAMRTGKYWQINVSPVYKGQRVLENTLTGLHAVMENGVVGAPQGTNAAYTDVTIRRKKDLKVIGWIGYFKTKKGFEKSVWMSAAEIDDHARKYVKDYGKNPNWNDTEKRPVMEMKTVLRQLLSWADMSGNENAQLVEALEADTEEIIDAPVVEMMTIEQARQVVIKSGKSEKFIGELSIESLNKIYLAQDTTDEQKQAAALVLAHDHNLDVPEAPKESKEQSIQKLGF